MSEEAKPKPKRKLPTHCPGCRGALKDTAKIHCEMSDRRSKPCGWVKCQCGTTVDGYGNHYPRVAA